MGWARTSAAVCIDVAEKLTVTPLQPKIDGIATTCPRPYEARARLPRSRALRGGRRRIRAPMNTGRHERVFVMSGQTCCAGFPAGRKCEAVHIFVLGWCRQAPGGDDRDRALLLSA